jgi:hypothetical protein
MIENKILKKKMFPPKFGGSTFSAFSKGQKSKFWKTPETKKMRNKTFKCSKLLLSFFKNQVNIVKNVELFKIVDYLTIMWKIAYF